MLSKKFTLSVLSLMLAIPGFLAAYPKNPESGWVKFAHSVAQHQGNYIMPTAKAIGFTAGIASSILSKRNGQSVIPALFEGVVVGGLMSGAAAFCLAVADFGITESLD